MTPETMREAIYRYGGTYVRTALIEGVEQEVVQVYDSAEGSEELLLVHDLAGERMEIELAALDFSYPVLGNINTENNVLHMSRTPSNFTRAGDRSYKRGWSRWSCDSNALSDAADFIPSPAPKEVFFPSYFPAERAISSLLLGERIATAFSPEFAVAIIQERIHPVLFNQGVLSGYVKEGVFFIPKIFDFIKEDLQRCCDVPVELIA